MRRVKVSPFVMTIWTCVDALTCAQIIKFEICKQWKDVVEEGLINYSEEAIPTESLALCEIAHTMKKIKIDTRLMDAGSRIS